MERDNAKEEKEIMEVLIDVLNETNTAPEKESS
jgi:hypothetical protein